MTSDKFGPLFALGPIEAREALTNTHRVIAYSPSGTVSSRLHSITSQRIWSRGTLPELTGRASVPRVTQTADVFHGIPGCGVGASCLCRQVLLRPASPTVVAEIGTRRPLTRHPFVADEAFALTQISIAPALVRALYQRVEVIGSHHLAHPGESLRTCALRAIRTRPIGLAPDADVTDTVHVQGAFSVTRAIVVTVTSLAMARSVPHLLAPLFREYSWGTGRIR